jgi:hypothetical protein
VVPSALLLAPAVLVEMWLWFPVQLLPVQLLPAQLVPWPFLPAKALESTSLARLRSLPVMLPTLEVLDKPRFAVVEPPLSLVEASLYQAALLSLELVVLLT